MTQDIIEYISQNRINTTEVADAMGKTGHIPGPLPVTDELFRVGKVRCVFTANYSNYDVHEQIKAVDKDDVVIIFTHNCDGRSIIGDLISKYILLYRQAKALIVMGSVRDVSSLKREKFPIWSIGVSPIGCFNKKTEPFPEEERKRILEEYEGAVAVCDDGGVVVVPKNLHNKDMLSRLERIEMQEDVWFFCLDALKWDTKKIVCDKAYLDELEQLPEVFRHQAQELSKPLDH